jgi:hypothetical protein
MTRLQEGEDNERGASERSICMALFCFVWMRARKNIRTVLVRPWMGT